MEFKDAAYLENVGRWGAAAEAWEQQLTSLETSSEMNQERAGVLVRIVHAHLEGGDPDRAETFLADLRTLALGEAAPDVKGSLALADGMIKHHRNLNTAAITALELAVSCFGPDTDEHSQAVLCLAAAHRAQGHVDRVEEILDSIDETRLPTTQAVDLKNERGELLLERGSYQAAVRVLEEALRLDCGGDSTYREGKSRLLLARACIGTGDRDKAYGLVQQAIADYARVQDDAGLSDAYSVLGEFHEKGGDLTNAIRAFEKGLQLDQKGKDLAGRAKALRRLGAAHRMKGDAEASRRLLGDAEAAVQEMAESDAVELAAILVEQANLHIDLGEYLEAREKLEQARTLIEHECGARRLTMVKMRLARTARMTGDRQTAKGMLLEAKSLFESRGDDGELERVLDDLAEMYLDEGDHQRATDAASESLRLDRRLRASAGEAQSHLVLGRSYLARGQYQRAEEHFKDALQIYEKCGNDAGRSRALYWLGMWEAARGRGAHAADYLREGLRIDTYQRDRRGALRANLALAAVHRRQGDVKEAKKYLSEAERDLPARVDDVDRALLQVENAQILLARGQLRAAQEEIRAAEEVFQRTSNVMQVPACQRIRAIVEGRLGNVTEAERLFREAETVFENAEEDPAVDELLDDLAEAYVRDGHFEKAEEAVAKSDKNGRKIGFETGNGRSALIRAKIALLKGNLSLSRTQAEEAMRIFAPLDEAFGQVEALLVLAECDRRQGDRKKTLERLKEARRIAWARDNQMGLGRCYRMMARVYVERGECAQAEEALEDARDCFTGIDDDVENALLEFVNGLLRACCEEHETALTCLRNVKNSLAECVDTSMKEDLSRAITVSLLALGRFDEAVEEMTPWSNTAVLKQAAPLASMHRLVREAAGPSLRLGRDAAAVRAGYEALESRLLDLLPRGADRPGTRDTSLPGLLVEVERRARARQDESRVVAWSGLLRGAYQLFRSDARETDGELGSARALSNLAVMHLAAMEMDRMGPLDEVEPEPEPESGSDPESAPGVPGPTREPIPGQRRESLSGTAAGDRQHLH